MAGSTAAYWMLMMVTVATVTGKPLSTMRTQKRQSDQRVAELETLLALQKYGAHHFLRSQNAEDGEGSYFPAYGIIDFNKIGRKKKSSPPPSQQDEEDGAVQNWLLSPSSSWASPPINRNPSSDTIRISSRSNTNSIWKAALDPITADLESLDDDTEN